MTEIIVLSLIFISPAILVFVKDILWDLYFWQIKEYRFDRFLNYFWWDQEHKNRNEWITGFKFICFAGLSLMFIEPIVALISIFLVFGIWTFEAIDVIGKIQNKSIRRPSLKKPRNTLIIILILISITISFVFLIGPFAAIKRDIDNGTANIEDFVITLDSAGDEEVYPDVYILLALLAAFTLLIDLGSTLFVALFVWLTSPIAAIRRDLTIWKARAAFNKHKNLSIIGITGSQGKTTTKEILFDLISSEKKTIKTPENYNTDYGVGISLLNKLNRNTQFFIAEMGAYKKGEIRKICHAFPPEISIITDIDTQHVGLFGSHEKLKQAKFEIIENMKHGGVAVVNGDSNQVLEAIKSFDGILHIVSTERTIYKKLEKYGLDKKPILKVYLAENIKENKNRIDFEVKIDNKNYTFIIHQRGLHLVTNALLAIATAHQIGIEIKTIQENLGKIKDKLPRLQIDTGDNGTIIINDSYNSAVKGFIAAVDVMHKIKNGTYVEKVELVNKKSKTIVVTKGIIELGKYKKSVYKRIAKETKDKIDILITKNKVLAKIFRTDNHSVKVIEVEKDYELFLETRKQQKPGDVILVEGRMPPGFIKEIISDKA